MVENHPIAMEEDDKEEEEEEEEEESRSDIIRRVLVMQQVQNYSVAAVLLCQAAIAVIRDNNPESDSDDDPDEAGGSEDEDENKDIGWRSEVVEVPAGSQEAKKLPLWRPHGSNSTDERAGEERPPSATPDPASKPTSGTRLGPRKPRTTLPALPILDSSKAKKIMDWRAHVASQLASQSSNVQDELTANRLEKVDSLQRVQDRRQDVLEGSKPNKRRKI